MDQQKERPPPISGKAFSSRTTSLKNTKVASALNKLIPANSTIKKIRQMGDSIPKLSDHADSLGIKLKPYDSPVLGIHGTIRSRAASAYNRRKLTETTSTDLLAKFDDAVKNPEARLTRKISQNLQQMNSVNKTKPELTLTHSFLLGDKETIEEEMTKLQHMVTSQAEATLGYGFELGNPKAIQTSRTQNHNLKNKHANSESQRSLRAMSTKIDKKVNQWMKSHPGAEEARNRKQLVRRLPSETLTGGDTIEKSYAVNAKLKAISDQFHKSLSIATSNAREMIKTPDEDYVQGLAKKTQDSLAKMSITEGDIDAVFREAINNENNSPPYGFSPRINNSLSRPLFKPLHRDTETQKKLHNYVARRKEPFSQRPPRKDFVPDYENPVELFKDVDTTDPKELQKRRSLIDASEPQIFQRTIDNGQLNNHRKIVDPNYRPSSITHQKLRWDLNSPNDSAIAQRKFNVTSNSALNKGKPLKASALEKTSKEMAKKYYPNSRREDVINRTLDRSNQNIEDATKVANALGTLMSRVALSDNLERSYLPMELTGTLRPPAVGSKSLRLLQSPGERPKGNIATLAAELRQMADDNESAYKAEMNKVQQRYTSVDEMKMQDQILKYSQKNNLSLIPGVSYTDQMLLKKLKSLGDFPK